MKPLAVVVFSSYDELMKDVDFLGSLGGQPQASQMIDQMLQMFTQNKGLAGLDKSKPIGVDRADRRRRCPPAPSASRSPI